MKIFHNPTQLRKPVNIFFKAYIKNFIYYLKKMGLYFSFEACCFPPSNMSQTSFYASLKKVSLFLIFFLMAPRYGPVWPNHTISNQLPVNAHLGSFQFSLYQIFLQTSFYSYIFEPLYEYFSMMNSQKVNYYWVKGYEHFNFNSYCQIALQ